MASYSRPKLDRSLRRIVVGRGRTATVAFPPRGALLSTATTLVEGVHFDLAYMTPRELGHKALAIALSDVASFGGKPQYVQVTVGVRQETNEPFLLELESGLQSLARRHKVEVRLIPNLDSPTALLVQLTVVAAVAKEPVGYDGARVGDLLVVTGSLGGSAAGLACLQRLGRHALRDREALLREHLMPEPRLTEAAVLMKAAPPRAMVDLSDGLASELHLLTERSGVGALVDQSLLPLGSETRQAAELISSNPAAWMLYGGEDFELLLAMSEANFEKARKKVPLTVIGAVRPKKEGVRLRDSQGELVAFAPKLWHNFVRRRKVS